jgi:hypothetical protein
MVYAIVLVGKETFTAKAPASNQERADRKTPFHSSKVFISPTGYVHAISQATGGRSLFRVSTHLRP